MKKICFVIALLLITVQAAHSKKDKPKYMPSSQPTEKSCQAQWFLNSRERSILSIAGKNYNQDQYVAACKAGTLPNVSPTY